MYTDYTEFELIIEPRTGGGYPFAVRSPGGEARGLLRPPTDDPALQGQLARLAALDADEALLTTIGQALFSALFAAPAKELLVRSQAMLAAHQGLRLKLCLPLGDEQLAALPWELLYDPDQGPLALLDAPIVRYLPQPTPLPTLRAALPLRVLLSAAEPGPEVARELAEVQAALAELAGHVQITVEPALTGPKLQQLLREGFHVWHFVGRSQPTAAGRPGGLAIGGAGSAELIGPAQLGILLNRSGLRLVVLDDIGGERLAAAALQGFAPALLRAQVGALVTTQFTAPAESARAFVGEFYRTLAAGFPIDACVTEGRKAVMGASGLGCADWALPVVYTRAPDARLFELPPAADLPGALLATQVDQSFARATVSSFAGTLLQPGQPPAIQRIEQRPRAPRALRSFRDRATEQQALLPELQPGRGAWLYGPDGCGLTALLRQAANSPPAGALPDGVLFLDGVAAPDTLDDLAQQLFERFYTSETAVRVAPASARSYLGELQALFIFDELPLSGDQLMALADILTRGTVLIAASGAAPDTLLGLALRGLPRADARTLLADEARLEPAPPEALLDQLAEALGDLPLALLLAGRVLQLRLAPAEQLAAVLAEALAEPDPLARAARLSLTPLEPAEREVLTALVHIGGPDAALDALAATSQVPADRARAALDRLCELRLVEGGGDRYAVASPGLGHVLARLLPAGEQKARAAAFFAGAAALHLRDLGWLARELPSLRAAVETLLAAGRPAEAGALARAIQPVLTLRGRWGQWGQLIDWANRAADASGDLRLKAWALHEQGSRLGLLGERAAALAALSEARRLRLSLHDSVGAQASQQNLSLLELLPPPPAPPERRWPALKWLAPVLLLLALLGGGATLASRLRSQESAPTATALAPTAPPAATPLAPGGTAPPAPTLPPSATASATPNPTATASPLPPSATASASPTLSPTATASATPSPTVTASPTPAPLCTVIGAGISVRAGPGVIYPTIGRLARGDSFTPLARDRQGFWVQLRLGQRLGWVSVLPGILSCTVAPGELPPGTIPPTPLPTSTATLVPTPTLAPAPTLAPTATPLPAPTSAQPTARPRRTATPTPARPTRPPRPTATATVPILR